MGNSPQAGTPWEDKTTDIFHKLRREQEKGNKGDQALIRKYLDATKQPGTVVNSGHAAGPAVDPWPEATQLHAQ